MVMQHADTRDADGQGERSLYSQKSVIGDGSPQATSRMHEMAPGAADSRPLEIEFFTACDRVSIYQYSGETKSNIVVAVVAFSGVTRFSFRLLNSRRTVDVVHHEYGSNGDASRFSRVGLHGQKGKATVALAARTTASGCPYSTPRADEAPAVEHRR